MSLPFEPLTGKILGSAFEVSNELGAGFLESVYEGALLIALNQRRTSRKKGMEGIAKKDHVTMSKMNDIEKALAEIHEGHPEFADLRLATLLLRDPSHQEALRLRVELASRQHHWPLAEILQSRLIELAPQEPDDWSQLGEIRWQFGHLHGAEAAFRKACALGANTPRNLQRIGQCLEAMGRPGDAREALQRAWRLCKDPFLAGLLGHVSHQLGLHAQAESFILKMAEQKPELVWMDLLYHKKYRSPTNPKAYLNEVRRRLPAEYRIWRDPHGIFPPADDPRRRLRIGYLSGDYRVHAVASHLEDFLAAHDREQFEVIGLSEVHQPDAVTRRFQGLADQWMSTVGLSDKEAATRIRAEKMDILVDLSGFTHGHRLGILAQRAAPIQVAHPMGYAFTRGMPNVDVKLTDEVTEPLGLGEAWNTEALIRLDGPRIAFHWPEEAPEVGPQPCLSDAAFTFTCLNTPDKLGEEAISLLAKVLRAVPSSRLLCLWYSMDDEVGIEFRRSQFTTLGIEADRIELLPRAPKARYLAYFHRADIVLDPPPAFGGTSVLEALWMGVPVLHLDHPQSPRHPGRYLLQQLGLDEEWVVGSKADYVAHAATWAALPHRLAQLRATMRERLKASPVSNPRAVALAHEKAYRRLWIDWCAGRPPGYLSGADLPSRKSGPCQA